MSNSKSISRFRSETFGFFIHLADGGMVGVNRRTGEILLDEGEGPDTYHGAVIRPDDFRRFFLESVNAVSSRMELSFGEHDVHHLGDTTDLSAAKQWILQAESEIRAHQKNPAPADAERHDDRGACSDGYKVVR